MFTNSPLSTLEAETSHGDHMIIEQVIADLKAGPLAHLPLGLSTVKAAWLVCAVRAFNLTGAAGVIASRRHGRARTATIRIQLINAPGPDRQPHQEAAAAPAHRLALTDRLGEPLPPCPCDRYLHRLTRYPLTAREGTEVEKSGRPADP